MLEVKNIDLFYGAAQALRGISLNVEPGRVTCVLGRNGVGKTSLLRAIVGQQPISAGSIVLDGKDITKLVPYERARLGVGYVPQGPRDLPAADRRGEFGDRLRAPAAREPRCARRRLFAVSGAAGHAAPAEAATSPAASSNSSPSRARW